MNLFSLVLTVLLTQAPASTPNLESPSPKERMAAIEQLARPGNTDAIATFAAALKKESKPDLRAEMLAGLVRIGGKDVPPVLAATLATDPDKDVRLQAIESLQELYIPAPENSVLDTLFNRVKSAVAEPERTLIRPGVAVDKISYDALATAMQKDTNVPVRAAAARGLGNLLAKDYVTVMVSTLEDPLNRQYKTVRLEIVESLGVIRNREAGPALQKTMREDDFSLTRESVVALGLMGYEPARPQLEDLFRSSPRHELKDQAIESIALLRDPGAKPLLMSLLNDKSDLYREKAAEGLARIDYDAASLADALKTEKKPSVRNAMNYALVASNHDEYINELAGSLNGRLSNQAEVYLYELGKYRGKVSLLSGYLRSSDPKVRAGMARVLGQIGDPASRGPLEELAKDPNVDVVRESVNALRQMNTR